MTRSFDTRPIPGVMCLLPKSLEMEVDMLRGSWVRIAEVYEVLGSVRRIDEDLLNMLEKEKRRGICRGERVCNSQW